MISPELSRSFAQIIHRATPGVVTISDRLRFADEADVATGFSDLSDWAKTWITGLKSSARGADVRPRY